VAKAKNAFGYFSNHLKYLAWQVIETFHRQCVGGLEWEESHYAPLKPIWAYSNHP